MKEPLLIHLFIQTSKLHDDILTSETQTLEALFLFIILS